MNESGVELYKGGKKLGRLRSGSRSLRIKYRT